MIPIQVFLVLAFMFLYCFWFILDRFMGTTYSIDCIFKWIPSLVKWIAIFILAIPYAIFVESYKRWKIGYRIKYVEYHIHFSFKKPASKKVNSIPYKPASVKRVYRRRYNWLYRRFAYHALRGIPYGAVYSYRKIMNSAKWKF